MKFVNFLDKTFLVSCLIALFSFLVLMGDTLFFNASYALYIGMVLFLAFCYMVAYMVISVLVN